MSFMIILTIVFVGNLIVINKFCLLNYILWRFDAFYKNPEYGVKLPGQFGAKPTRLLWPLNVFLSRAFIIFLLNLNTKNISNGLFVTILI